MWIQINPWAENQPPVSCLLKSLESHTWLRALLDGAHSILGPWKWDWVKGMWKIRKSLDWGDSRRNADAEGGSCVQSALWFFRFSRHLLSFYPSVKHANTHTFTHQHTVTSTCTHTYKLSQAHTCSHSLPDMLVHTQARTPSLTQTHTPVQLFALLKEKRNHSCSLDIRKQYVFSHRNTLKCYPICYHSGLRSSQHN